MPGCKNGGRDGAATCQLDKSARAAQPARKHIHCDHQGPGVHSPAAATVSRAHPAHPVEFGLKPEAAPGICPQVLVYVVVW